MRLGQGSPNTKGEFLRSLPVAAVTSVIDFGVLIVLTETLGFHYLVSAGVAFIVGQVWAYVVSVRWVFARLSTDNYASGFSIFLAISLIGLILTEVLLWAMTEEAGLYYLYSKMVVSAVLSLFLFFIRKRFLFS